MTREKGILINVLAAAAAVTASGAATALATVPAAIDQQGRFLKPNGDPEPGPLTVTFAIYAASAGGAALWTETLEALSLDKGFYAVLLGGRTPFPKNLWDGRTLFLGITVKGDPEMTPRQPLVSVPYAVRAAEAENAVGDITPRSITVGGKVIVDKMGTVTDAARGPAGPRGPSGIVDILSAEQTADLKTLGGTWLAVPGAQVTFSTTGGMRNLHIQADGSITASGTNNTGGIAGHCGFRFVLDGAPTTPGNWGDRILGCSSGSTGYSWCPWSMRRTVQVGPGAHTLRLEQQGWNGTDGGCETRAVPFSGAKLWVLIH